MAQPIPASARWGWRLGILAALLFILGPLIAYFEVLPPLRGFMIFALGGLLGIIATLTNIVGVIRHGVAGARGLILSGAVAAVFLLMALPGRNVPRINDITTDGENPPQFVAALSLPANTGRNMQYPGAEFMAQQRAGYPDLGPLRLPQPPDVVFARVRAVAAEMPSWKILREDAASRSLEGTDTTRIFRFKDDFVIEVRPDGTGSVVHMRSKSRDGKGDIGANAARIKRVFAALQANK